MKDGDPQIFTKVISAGKSQSPTDTTPQIPPYILGEVNSGLRLAHLLPRAGTEQVQDLAHNLRLISGCLRKKDKIIYKR